MIPNRIKNEAIIALLKGKAPAFLSGADMASALGVTRAAVWKKIRHLRKSGYMIEASPAKGYRLTGSPGLSIEEIKNALAAGGGVIGREIVFLDLTDSTNTVAAELAGKGVPEGTVVIANGQTAGRGRRGRAWLSPSGKNLYLSIILTPDIPPTEAPILTLMTAVACASALKGLSACPVSIKWPNDMMVSGRKLGGILTEIKADPDRVFYAIIGIGININLGAEDTPGDLKGIATSIKVETGKSQSRTRYAIEILREMGKWYNTLLRMGKPPIIREWLRLSSTIGRHVKVTVGEGIVTGTAEEINDEGMLMLRLPDNSLKRITSGDITYI